MCIPPYPIVSQIPFSIQTVPLLYHGYFMIRETSAVSGAFSELTANTLLVVGALFPIVNPLGNTPIFLTLTRGLSGPGRTKLAWTIAVNGLALTVASIFIGTYILGFFGISLPVVQVGGLVVVSTGWALLRHSDDD